MTQSDSHFTLCPGKRISTFCFEIEWMIRWHLVLNRNLFLNSSYFLTLSTTNYYIKTCRTSKITGIYLWGDTFGNTENSKSDLCRHLVFLLAEPQVFSWRHLTMAFLHGWVCSHNIRGRKALPVICLRIVQNLRRWSAFYFLLL